MRLLHGQGSTTGETSEQTLERLNHASHRATASDEPRRPRFKVRYIAETYDIAEVDAFVSSIDRRTAHEIHNVHFTTVYLRGYDKAQVDRLLAECEARLRSASKPADPICETTGPAPAVSHGGKNKPRSRRARNVRLGVIWALGGVVLFLFILLGADLSWSDAAASWVIAVAVLGLAWFGGGGGGDGGGGWFDGGGFDGG